MECDPEPPENLKRRSLEGFWRNMKYTQALAVATPFDTNRQPRCNHLVVGSDFDVAHIIDWDALEESETQKDELAKYLLELLRKLPDSSLRSFR